MAIYHLTVKAISRSQGRSATAAAAYRSGEEIHDERTGITHDYTRKSGVKSADIVLPDNAPQWANNRAKLWNAAELAEKRKDSCVAREYEVALPEELPPEERKRLAIDFAKWLANNEGCAVDVAIHEPSKNGDNRNHHAHILKTTRKVEIDGLGEKLDSEKAGRKRKDDLDTIRVYWAELINQRLKDSGIDASVDHRTLKAQGIDRVPTQHKGVAVTAMEKRGMELDVLNRMAKQEITEIERQERELNKHIAIEQAHLASIKAEHKEIKAENVASGYKAFKQKKQTEEKTAMDYESFKRQRQEEQERQKANQQQTKTKKNKDHDLEM